MFPIFDDEGAAGKSVRQSYRRLRSGKLPTDSVDKPVGEIRRNIPHGSWQDRKYRRRTKFEHSKLAKTELIHSDHALRMSRQTRMVRRNARDRLADLRIDAGIIALLISVRKAHRGLG
ncbi:MAG: hypothetical protein IH604_05315 [Burkholderiales bacterium]|nr:hypothetical protein [Burkholderiales bacterium]